MHCSISEDQVRQYRHDGFTVIRDFLDAAEVDALTEAMQEAATILEQRRLERAALSPTDSDDKAPSKERQVFHLNVEQRLNMWKINDHIRSVFTAPELGALLCRLEAIDGIRLWHDQTLQKAPWGNPTGYHVDNPYWSFTSHHAISIWIALDPATVENGCLSFIPGSHRICRHDRDNPLNADFGFLFRTYPELAETEAVHAVMQPGDAAFHNGLTAHGAGANNTPGWRRAMTCAYMPEGSVFNGQRNVLPADYCESLKLGDVLDNDDLNPLVWSRSARVAEIEADA